MNPFMCVVDLSGDTVGIDALVAALPAVGRAGEQTEVMLHGAWGAAWVPAESFGRPAIAHRDGILALGSARITNRAALRPGGSRTGGGDLELIIERYLEHDTAGFRDVVGDFAVVLWDTRAHRLVAVRDALGVKTLFYQRTGNRLVVGSHLECFESARYDRSFLGDMLLGLRRGTERTVFADVTRLLPGTSLTADALGVRTRRYWDPAEFVAADAVPSEREAIAEFRRLFREAVLAQLDDGVSTWAQLSGGLDSSSVVAMAQGLAREGLVAPLAGTQTVVDSLAEGDETRYSDAVVRQYGLRNERIADYAAWQDDGQPPPDFSDPRLFLPFYARDRALRDVVRNAGGRCCSAATEPTTIWREPTTTSQTGSSAAGSRMRWAIWSISRWPHDGRSGDSGSTISWCRSARCGSSAAAPFGVASCRAGLLRIWSGSSASMSGS